MLKLFLLLILFSCFDLFATVRTVSNDPANPGQFSDLQLAINASLAGDTIYVHPSNILYNDVTIVRRINLFSAGFNTSLLSNYRPARINRVYLTIDNTLPNDLIGASGSILNGIYSNQIDGYLVNNVQINHCSFRILFSDGAGWIVKNSILGNGSSSAYLTLEAPFLIENNIFMAYGPQPLRLNYHSTNTGGIFKNNLVYTSGGWGGVCIGSSVDYSNNIFFKTNPNFLGFLFDLTYSSEQNSLNNNIFYGFSLPVIPPNNSGANNIINVNPGFISPLNQISNLPFLPDTLLVYDFRLSSSSPGRNAGSDGTDIGIYGGSSPWSLVPGLPPLPQVINLNILNVSVPVGGNINVQSRGVKRQ
jgi:hypothetical protein